MIKSPRENLWLNDPILDKFSDLESVEFQPMFGGVSVYQQRGNDKVCLVFTGGTATSGKRDGSKPEWRGLLVVTELKHHAALLKKFPDLAPNTVIKKWLQISDEHEAFGVTLNGVYELAKSQSELIGVAQKPRKRKRKNEPTVRAKK
jgi:hypothetical protein